VTLAVLMLALAASPPQVALVKRSPPGLQNTVGAAVLHAVGDALKAKGLAVTIEVLGCEPDASCLASAARSSSSVATVALTIARGRKELTIDLEAVDENEKSLGVATLSVPLSGEPLPEEGLRFLGRVADGLLKPVVDAPKAVVLAPAEQPLQVAVVAASPAPSRLPAKAAGGAAIILGVATVALLVAGTVMKGDFDARVGGPRIITSIRRAQAEEQATLINDLFTASTVGAGLTTAAAGAAGLLLATQ
jgi:hypothetical protein